MKKYILSLIALVGLELCWSQTMLPIRQQGTITTFEVTSDRKHAIFCSPGQLGLLDVRRSKVIKEFTYPELDNIQLLRIQSDSSRAFFGARNGKVYQLNISSGNLEVLTDMGNTVTSMAILEPDRLLVSSRNGNVQLWDIPKKERLKEIQLEGFICDMTIDQNSSNGLALSTSGQLFSVSDQGAFSEMWSADEHAFSMAYNAKDQKIVIGTTKYAIFLKYQSGRVIELNRTKGSDWAVAASASENLGAPALAYSSGLIKIFSANSVFRYKIPSSLTSIAYVMDENTRLNVLALDIRHQLHFVGSLDWKYKD